MSLVWVSIFVHFAFTQQFYGIDKNIYDINKLKLIANGLVISHIIIIFFILLTYLLYGRSQKEFFLENPLSPFVLLNFNLKIFVKLMKILVLYFFTFRFMGKITQDPGNITVWFLFTQRLWANCVVHSKIKHCCGTLYVCLV